MRRRLLMQSHSLLASEKLLTNVAAERGTMRQCVAMLIYLSLDAEPRLAFVTCVSAAEGGVLGARVVFQRLFGSAIL